MPTDEELMARYLSGDRDAFRELFRRYAPLVLRLVSRDLRPDEANDLVQQTFLLLHRARNDFKSDARLRPWLCTIAVNARRQYLRDTLRHKTLDREFAEARVDRGFLAVNDAEERVRAALAGLPADQREVIVLHWMQGLSFREIAHAVGASLGAVKVRAHRGYLVMRQALNPNDDGGE